MKKILGLLFCMGIFLIGHSAAYGSPPGGEKVQHETTTAITVAPAIDAGHGLSASDIETLERASDRAWNQVLADHAAELQANAVDRVLVAKLTKKMDRHRWRNYSNRRADPPIYIVYRPGWNRKVCEG
ncbi:MAG: hypothetical protein LBV18_04010 [Alistipes sp.]|nr:hypothetical protein [Alistipes sp.]